MNFEQRRLQAIKNGWFPWMTESNNHSTTEANAMEDIVEMPSWPERAGSLPPTFKMWEAAEENIPKRDLSTSSKATFRQSCVVSPLDILSIKDSTPNGSEKLQTQQPQVPPLRIYGGAAGKIQDRLSVGEVTVDFSHIQPLPRPPRKTWRSSLNRLSLTPSEMPYPINLLRSNDEDREKYERTREMLGIRRVTIAPPVPPKDPRRYPDKSATSSESSLPLHKDDTVSLESVEEPLNGRTAWLHSLTGMLVVFNCWGLGNAFGLFQAYYSTVYLPTTSPSAIAWIGSTQLALVFGLGVPVGRLVDKGYFRIVFHGGSVVAVLGLCLSAFCTKLWSLWLVNGLVTGLGMGMCFCSGIVALMTWFDERKIGAAMGLGAAGSCIGGIVYVLLARHFLARNGFKTTMLILAAVATVTLVPPNLVFRVRGQRYRPKRARTATTAKSRLSWRTFAEPSYLLAAAGLFFSFLGVYFGFVYIISFASEVLRLSDTASANLLIFMLAANLPGRFLPALISDRCIGPLNTIIPSVFLSSAVIWLWAASGEHRGSLTVIACFYGFVSAGIQALYAPTVYSFCLEPLPATPTTTVQEKQVAMDRIGVKAGGIFTCIGIACLIGLPIGGALIRFRTERGLSQPYLGAQVFAGVSLLLGGVLLLASRVKKNGWAARRA